MASAAKLTISANMLRNHLSVITVGWFDNRNLPPPTVQGYAALRTELRELVTETGDLPWFVLGLQHILLDGSIHADEYANTRFAYSDADAREIMEYVLAELAPGQSPDPKGPAAQVELKEMNRKEWAALRDSQKV